MRSSRLQASLTPMAAAVSTPTHIPPQVDQQPTSSSPAVTTEVSHRFSMEFVNCYDWNRARSQDQVFAGEFACFCISIAISLASDDVSLKKQLGSIKDADSTCVALETSLLNLMHTGAALATSVRRYLTKSKVEVVDDAVAVTPDGIWEYLGRHTMLFEDQQVDVASGIVCEASYKDQVITLRTPGIVTDLHGEWRKCPQRRALFTTSSSVQQLATACFATKSSCVLHLTMEFGPNSETPNNVLESHTTLLIWLADDLCCHIDTFPGCSIRVDEDVKRSLKGKSRIHYHSQQTFYQWFVTTYIPAGTPFQIEASRFSSKLLSVINILAKH